MRKLADDLRVALPDNDHLATGTIARIHPIRVKQWLDLARFDDAPNSMREAYRSAEATGRLLRSTVSAARAEDEGRPVALDGREGVMTDVRLA